MQAISQFKQESDEELADRAMAALETAGETAGLTPEARNGLEGLARWALEGPD